MVFSLNPFNEGGGVGSTLPPDWFVGFSELSETLALALESNERPVLVTGPRQSGKSTLTDTLKARTDMTVISIDLRDLPSDALRGEGSANDAIARHIVGVLSYELLPSVRQDVTMDDLLGEILSGISADKTLVVLVDELDALSSDEDQCAFVGAVLASYGGTGTAVRWVIIRGENWGSPSCRLPGVQEIRTRPLVIEEVRAILACHVTHGLYAFDPAVAERILEATGGYPLFVRSILFFVFEGRRRLGDDYDVGPVVLGPEVEDAIDKVASDVPETVRHACMMTWPATVRLLRVIVTLDGTFPREELRMRFHEEWPRWDEAFSETLDALCRVSLVRETSDGFRLAVPLLARIMAQDANGAGFWMGRNPCPRAWHYIRRGEDAMRRGKADDAIADFRAALVVCPSPYWLFEALVRFPTAERLMEAEGLLAWMREDAITIEDPNSERHFRTKRELLDAAWRTLSP